MRKMGLSLQPHPLATAAKSAGQQGKQEMDIFHRPFTDKQLNEYEECTYFTRKEILRLYRRFHALNPTRIDRKTGDVTTRLSFLDIQSMPELQHNPFKVSSYIQRYNLFSASYLVFRNASVRCLLLTKKASTLKISWTCSLSSACMLHGT